MRCQYARQVGENHYFCRYQAGECPHGRCKLPEGQQEAEPAKEEPAPIFTIIGQVYEISAKPCYQELVIPSGRTGRRTKYDWQKLHDEIFARLLKREALTRISTDLKVTAGALTNYLKRYDGAVF